MRFIKLAVISIIVLFLVITGFSLFIPSEIRISRAADIYCTKDSLKAVLHDPLEWKVWYPGADSMDIFYIEGKPSGLIVDADTKTGLVIGEKNDSMVIAVNTGASIRKEITTGWKMIETPAPDVMTVQWFMDFTLRWYPWEKFSSLFFEKIYGRQMEEGLAALKNYLEKDRSSLN